MKSIVRGILVSLLLVTGLIAADQANHIRVFTSDNSDGKITAKTIQSAFEKAGFMVEANNDMNAPFKRDFNNTNFDVYNLMVLWRKDTILALAEKYPEIGLFAPMSMSIYTKKGDKTISVSSITPAGMASMIGIPEENKALADLGKKVEEALKAAMPKGKFVELPYKMKAPKGELVHKVAFDQKGSDWEEEKDDIEMAFEGELAPNGFVSPAFVDLNFDLDEHDKDWYTFYDAYSICKIKVIYTVSKLHPEAGALAPCTMYFYQKRDEKKFYMGFPTVQKWISALNIEDKESIDVLLDAQKRFENILSKITKK
ncbi:hypothetical protein MNB_SV-6-205 [hydrothermal vent metagenome]|uniref:DUF302 domain-containing protein n=1 Tax=hydrothermal vent metagenome TaxID=652676 RepID=A0A1W1BGQ7_9ZZZZ